MKKVYCGECEYFWESRKGTVDALGHMFERDHFGCNAPENYEKKSTFSERGVTSKPLRLPAEINVKNDCGWYSSKEDARLRESLYYTQKVMSNLKSVLNGCRNSRQVARALIKWSRGME
jgi:hypothetical protein